MERGSITDPVEMTADERRNFLDTYPCVEELFTCVRGHDGCSISRAGVCLDDVLRYMEAHGEMKSSAPPDEGSCDQRARRRGSGSIRRNCATMS